MSARDLLAARMLDDDGGGCVDRIGPDLLAAIAELDELAALKARRCDGCECFMVADHAIPGYGYCLLPNLRQDGPVSADLGYPVPQVPPDHACNAWMAKEPTT